MAWYKMNGDLQTIYEEIKINGNRLTKIETKQELQHQENKTVINEIKLHIVECSNNRGQIRAQWFFIAAILVGLIGMWVKN